MCVFRHLHRASTPGVTCWRQQTLRPRTFPSSIYPGSCTSTRRPLELDLAQYPGGKENAPVTKFILPFGKADTSGSSAGNNTATWVNCRTIKVITSTPCRFTTWIGAFIEIFSESCTSDLGCCSLCLCMGASDESLRNVTLKRLLARDGHLLAWTFWFLMHINERT